ncbi:MAG: PAS domain S-box protein, partial [Actinomycetota bacterium]
MTDGLLAIFLVIGFGLLAIASILLVTIDARRNRGRLDQSHAELRATHDAVRSLLDGLPDAVLRLDARGIVTSANTRASELTGRSVESLIGRSFLGFVAEADRDGITARWRRLGLGRENLGDELGDTDGANLDDVGEGREVTGVLFELVDEHRATHLVEASLHRPPIEPTSDDAHDPVGIVVILRDVTDRERSSAALEAARTRFQQAFHSAPTGMALVRLSDHRIVDANQALADMLDHSRRYLLGRSMREITHPDDLRAAAPERARLELGIDDGYQLEQVAARVVEHVRQRL